jgi:hypothetical protein
MTSVKIGVILPSTARLPCRSMPKAVTKFVCKSNRVQRKFGVFGVIIDKRDITVSRLTAVAGIQTRSDTTGLPMLARAAVAMARGACGVSIARRVWVCCHRPAWRRTPSDCATAWLVPRRHKPIRASLATAFATGQMHMTRFKKHCLL